MRWHRSLVVAALLAACPAFAQVAPLGGDERDVLAAAIEQTRLDGSEKWVMVGDQAASLQCDKSAMINVGGCGGMRPKAQSVDDVMAWLEREFPAAGASLLADFRTKVESGGATLREPLPLAVKQVLWGRVDGKWGAVAGGPLPKEKPDYFFNVSRVGFDASHEEALAYVAGISWTNAKRQYAEYVHLRKSGEGWKVDKRVRVWELNGGRQPAGPSPQPGQPDAPVKR